MLASAQTSRLTQQFSEALSHCESAIAALQPVVTKGGDDTTTAVAVAAKECMATALLWKGIVKRDMHEPATECLIKALNAFAEIR